jgi:hypothetical protein
MAPLSSLMGSSCHESQAPSDWQQIPGGEAFKSYISTFQIITLIRCLCCCVAMPRTWSCCAAAASCGPRGGGEGSAEPGPGRYCSKVLLFP